MRILAITPIAVDAAELARRQARYDRLSPPEVEIVLRDIGPSAPGALDSAADVRASELAVIAAFRAADPDGFDAYLPDCVLDPGAEEATSFERPLLGLTRLTASFLATPGARIGAVARNEAIADELDRRLEGYGVSSTPATVLGLELEAIADDAAWGAAVSHGVADLQVDYVVNACSAVDVSASSTRPYVVDPTAVALRLLGMRGDIERGVA